MNETDTVFGAVEKLKRTIRAAYERHHPKVIYVTTCCVSSIIGDDVYAVTQEMSEELGIPVGFGAMEGIKSKIWASGFDAFQHAVNQTLLKEPGDAARLLLINFIGFTKVGQKRIDSIFLRFGLEVNYLVGGASHEDYARASRAIGTFIQCGSQSSYLAGTLEQRFGVKFFQAHMPYGGIGFERFIREIAAYIGKEDIGEKIIRDERERWLPDLERIRKILIGKTAVISLGGSYAFEFLRILGELGVKVLHTSAYHFDPRLDNQSADSIGVVTDVREVGLSGSISVNDIQQFETHLLFQKFRPDFIVSRAHGGSPLAVSLGIPAVEATIGIQIFGYDGLVHFGQTIVQELENSNFIQKVSSRYRSPFLPAYEEQEPFIYLEKERAKVGAAYED
jgi:nitrogenase molybdenum-iron protein alpha chain